MTPTRSITAFVRRAPLLLLVPLTLGLSACGDDETSADDRAAATVEHALGTTEVPAAPKRIVSLGGAATDAAIALGVTPIAGPENLAAPGQARPWHEGHDVSQMKEIAGAVTGQVKLDQILALKPDLIFAGEFANAKELYPQLAKIAPTIAYQEGPYEDSWQTTTTVVGQALGRESQAKDLIAKTEAQVARVAADHPGLDGRTWTFFVAQSPSRVGVLVNPKDSLTTLLGELGLKPVPAQQRLKIDASTPGVAGLSIEQARRLDADVVFGTYPAPPLRKAIEGNGVFGQLDAVRDGRYLALDLSQGGGLRAPTVLALPWSLELLEPTLKKVEPAA
ncbi:MAG: ABC transporter substrate-binding protein [Solirubrobacteraceae bacterium]|nr:ABC transporter substrate-binding protein [Solirubrobacteraceae bacterium]